LFLCFRTNVILVVVQYKIFNILTNHCFQRSWGLFVEGSGYVFLWCLSTNFVNACNAFGTFLSNEW
jgi:hypothetical protein